MAKINCAIYVRKSTEKGLELEFNSLHNQEEACKNYILSQTFNNWEYYKTYTDGGISGGTMEREALKEMLSDISKGLIQIIVVYKVDRLSRSIIDFHNMMKEFNKYNCNFVSITQAFDTSNSMGKLTLNMLLSFAQFEREVSSERVKDKIYASKSKGYWMGGNPRLGYDVIDKKLVINLKEAEQIKNIFEKYLELSSVTELTEYVKNNNIKNKQWKTKNGSIRGGKELGKTSIHRILRDKVYIGSIENKKTKEAFNGQHLPLIPKELFNKVQEKLKLNTNGKSGKTYHSPNLLSNKLYNNDGKKFINQVVTKESRGQIRYYAIKGLYINTQQIDTIVKNIINNLLNADLSNIGNNILNIENNKLLNQDSGIILSQNNNKLNRDNDVSDNNLLNILLILKQINFNNMDFYKQKDFIREIIEKVIYSTNKIIVFFKFDLNKLKGFIEIGYFNNKEELLKYSYSKSNCGNNNDDISNNSNIINITIEEECYLLKGTSPNKYNNGKIGLININENNNLIVRDFAYAWKYKQMYESGISAKDIAKTQKLSLRTLYKYFSLAYLSPNIVNKLLSGKINISINKLHELASKSIDFQKQEELFNI